MPEKGKRYIRTSSNGDQSIVFVTSKEDAEYHQDLSTKGFKYKEVIPTVAPGSTCTSCEG